ncbi:MAG TPA: hypothetical protein VGM81_21695 [Burkholderiaceae bacterium]
MATQNRSFRPWSSWVMLSLAGTPALIFYWLLSKTVADRPLVDDYYAVLAFVNHFSQLADVSSKLSYIVNFQHNEYKLAFENAIFAAQYELFGKINFSALSMLGNSFVLVLFALLASTFRISIKSNGIRTLALLPVGLLLFQLQYASTLNFAMAGLQNIPVLVFVLLSIMLLSENSPLRFAGSCVAMLLAIASSGGGFLLLPVGATMLAERRRWKHLGAWIIFSVAIASVYFSNYNFHSSQSNPDGSVTQSAAHFSITYMLAFMGASVARYQGYFPSICVGVALSCLLAFAIWKGYSKENPTVLYFAIFLILTAAGVSAIRSGFGIEQSLASRYRVYSNLLLILSYIFLAETYLPRIRTRNAAGAVTAIVVACSLAFFVLSNMAGFRFLKGRQQAVAYEMAAWQTSVPNTPGRPTTPAAMNLDPAVSRQLATGLYRPDTATLMESMRLGFYHPPEFTELPPSPSTSVKPD